VVGGVAISPDGLFGAASTVEKGNTTWVISVWDLVSTEEVKVLEFGDGDSGILIHFSEDGSLLSAGASGLLRWDVETGDSEVLFDEPVRRGAVSADGTRALLFQTDPGAGLTPSGRGVVHDLNTGLTTPLSSHGDSITAIAMDPRGTIAVTGDKVGIIRVGPISGEEPHLLFGHRGQIYALAVDPLGRWIASSGQDNTVRLWPMPDLSKPPLHTVPREELIAKLKTLTNLRVVRDEESATGWKLEVGPFPGWAEVPEW
jgi:WD40 repeat protein